MFHVYICFMHIFMFLQNNLAIIAMSGVFADFIMKYLAFYTMFLPLTPVNMQHHLVTFM